MKKGKGEIMVSEEYKELKKEVEELRETVSNLRVEFYREINQRRV